MRKLRTRKCGATRSSWREGDSARLSPATRGVSGLHLRIERLEEYERWRQPKRIDFAAVVGAELWNRHRQNWRDVLTLLRKSQDLASEIRGIVASASGSTKHLQRPIRELRIQQASGFHRFAHSARCEFWIRTDPTAARRHSCWEMKC
jgi:hypothetical protein